MKQLFPFTLFLFLLVSCQKEIRNHNDPSAFLKNMKVALQDSLSKKDFTDLDFDKVYLSEITDGEIRLVRIPFSDKKIENDFVLVQTNLDGTIYKGRIIHIEKYKDLSDHLFNGTISITSLSRKPMIQSDIKNGFITAFHPDESNLRTNVVVLPQSGIIVLPEVVVVGYIRSASISYSEWYYLLGMFGANGSGTSGPYNPANGISGSFGGGSGNNNNPPLLNDQPIVIDFENQYSETAIELEKYMKCFSNIPDAGSTGSIEIFTDIPVNGDPSKFFDWSNGSPGHTFIQLRKQKGSQSVCQNIGFYPRTGWKTMMSPAPIAGKFVDNQGHEFNASYKINLTAAQVQTAVTKVLYLSRFVKYDIDDYNCTDWALDVFNETVKVSERLDIPRYAIPGGMAPNGTSTPNGVYTSLQQMKQAGGSTAAGISIPMVGWAGASNGPCN